MPIYEFVCEACGRLSEVMQRMTDPPPGACPECGGGPLARLVSRTSFQLKGGGWYSDLYSSPKEKPKPAAEGAPAPSTPAPAAASGGSKPAPATAPATATATAAPAGSSGGTSGGT